MLRREGSVKKRGQMSEDSACHVPCQHPNLSQDKPVINLEGLSVSEGLLRTWGQYLFGVDGEGEALGTNRT